MTQYGKITSFYSRRSVGEEDRDGGKSNSVVNQTGFVKDIFTENFIGFTQCIFYKQNVHRIDGRSVYKYFAKMLTSQQFFPKSDLRFIVCTNNYASV